MTLSVYRQKRGLSPVMNSNVSDEVFKLLFGGPYEDKKAKAWIGLVQEPSTGYMFQLDLAKAYLTTCFQGIHPTIGGFQDGLPEFDFKKYGWYVLSGYEKPEALEICGVDLIGKEIEDALYYIEFSHGSGPSAWDDLEMTLFTNEWYDASQVY
jgi:hypothetical protein